MGTCPLLKINEFRRRRLKRPAFTWLVFILACTIALPGFAVQSITGITTGATTGDTTGISNTNSAVTGSSPFNDTNDTWNVNFSGDDDDIATVEVGGDSYVFVALADSLTLKRVNNPQVNFERNLVFCRGAPVIPTSTINCDGSTFSDMETILLGRSVNYGTDNLFSNTTGNSNNIERVDYLYNSGISIGAASTGDVGFVVLERGGNDVIQVAAILSKDASQNPASYGPLVTINTADWGASGFNYESVVFRRDPTDTKYRPSADLGVQNIEGVFLTFSDLGIASGQTFFGYSIFPDDAGSDLVGLSNAPLASTNGLDLIEGGGFFQKVGSSTSFVDIKVTKSTNTPFVSAGAQVTFTITVENKTQNNAVIDAVFADSLPGDFSAISWTCQAFGSGTSCRNGSIFDNGLPSAAQSEPGNTINDIMDISIGGHITYIVTATLSNTASGLITNTASATPDASQTEISNANNSSSATITVQAAASGNKTIYLHKTQVMNRIPSDASGDRVNIKNIGDSKTWRTNPDMINTVTINSDIGLKVAMSAKKAGSHTIGFELNRVTNNGAGASTPLATATTTYNFAVKNTIYLVTPTVTMQQSTPFNLNPNDELELIITLNAGVDDIRIHESVSNSQSNMTRFFFATPTVINVDSITYAPLAPEPGDAVTITAVVSDPFGQADITAATFDWYDPDNQLILDDQVMSEVADSDPATKTYEYTYTLPDVAASNGDWIAIVTAVEGFETSPVTHTNGANVSVGTSLAPVLVIDKLVNGLVSDVEVPGGFPLYEITVTSQGPGAAQNVTLIVDIGMFVAFGVDSQAGQPFTFTDTGSPSLPTNFIGTIEVSVNNGAYQAIPAVPSYNPDITAVRIQTTAPMPVGSQFKLNYVGEVQ